MDIRNTIAGGVGAFCCVYNGMPFDVAKIRMQIEGRTSTSNGPFRTMYNIVRTEGFFALWKGATPALASALVENCVLFTANGALSSMLEELLKSKEKKEQLSVLQSACVGGASGIFSATAITPAELIKCTLQNQRGKYRAERVFRGPIHCAGSIIKKDGLMGLFRGTSALIARDVPFNFFFFGAYAGWCSILLSAFDYSHKDELSAPYVLFAGGAAGVTGWSIVFPFDVIKSRMQAYGGTQGASPLTFSQLATKIYAEHGLRGFYSGWSAAVLRAFPANGSLLLGYELSSRFFAWYDTEDT